MRGALAEVFKWMKGLNTEDFGKVYVCIAKTKHTQMYKFYLDVKQADSGSEGSG